MSKEEYFEAIIKLRDKIKSSYDINDDERIKLINWTYEIESTMLGMIHASMKSVITCENIIEIVKLIDRVSDPFNISYKPEQKEKILNKLYDLLDFQIKLMEENEDE